MQTNLSWLQSLSDAEMAEFLFQFEKRETNDVLKYCKEKQECINNIHENKCKICLQEWLNTEKSELLGK